MIKKLALSGQLRAGKDYIAGLCGYPIVGFADPIYKMVQHLTGSSDKTVPGVREMLQKIGQWGWGHVSKEYPWTVERALLIKYVHEIHMRWLWHKENLEGFSEPHPFGDEFSWVDWSKYGTHHPNKDFWVKILLERADKLDRVANVNTRFDHELEPLRLNGFHHYHVRCSEETRLERLGGEAVDPKTLNDLSEQFALKCNDTMPDERIIWNDHRPVPEGKQYITVDQFKQLALQP